MEHLGINQEERSVDVLLAALEAVSDQEHRYTWEREMDNQVVLDTYYGYICAMKSRK